MLWNRHAQIVKLAEQRAASRTKRRVEFSKEALMLDRYRTENRPFGEQTHHVRGNWDSPDGPKRKMNPNMFDTERHKRKVEVARQNAYSSAMDVKREIFCNLYASRFDCLDNDKKKVITVGTDCCGLETRIFALENLGVPFKHVFRSELDPKLLEMIKSRSRHHL